VEQRGGDQVTPQIPPVDPGNTILSPGPAQLSATRGDVAGTPHLIVTVRTGSATVTVFLDKDQARDWSRVLGGGCAQLGGLIVGAPMPAGEKVPA
jgi:hypothetical protein